MYSLHGAYKHTLQIKQFLINSNLSRENKRYNRKISSSTHHSISIILSLNVLTNEVFFFLNRMRNEHTFSINAYNVSVRNKYKVRIYSQFYHHPIINDIFYNLVNEKW